MAKDNWQIKFNSWKAEKARREEKEKEGKALENFVEKVEGPIEKLTDGIEKLERNVVREVETEVKEVGEFIEKEEKAHPKVTRVIKILVVLIPLIILGYVFYANFIASHEFNSFYDIGSQIDAKKPYLSPLNRVSEIDHITSSRNITSGLVYFTIPLPKRSTSVEVSIRLSNPDKKTILLGAQDQAVWHYLSQSIYNSLLENLSQFNFLNSENYKIYQINKDLKLISNISDIPTSSLVANDLRLQSPINTNDYNLKNIIINTSLRGGHTFYIYLNDSLNLKVKKQDINWYNGSDELNISLYTLNNTLIAGTTIADDGIIKVNNFQSQIQEGELIIKNLQKGVYVLKFSDFDGLVREISLNTNKIVANKLFLADSDAYLNNATPSEIYLKTYRNSTLTLKTYHASSFQNILINNRKVAINQVSPAVNYNLSAGEYKIISPINDLIVSSTGFLSFSNDSYFDPFVYTLISIPSSFDQLTSDYDYLITSYTPSVQEGGWLITSSSFDVKDLYIKDGKLSMLLNIPDLGNSTKVGVDWINITVKKDGIF